MNWHISRMLDILSHLQSSNYSVLDARNGYIRNVVV